MDIKHYNQKLKRNAEFITPKNLLKAKVGTGGLSTQVIDRAQKLLENHTIDFTPLAEIYLQKMSDGIKMAQGLNNTSESEDMIAEILFPCVQLKSNGAMFHYPLITRIADRFVQFMEVVEKLDDETTEIALAFHTTMKIVVASKIKNNGGEQGESLVKALNDACMRYFEKHREVIEAKQKNK